MKASTYGIVSLFVSPRLAGRRALSGIYNLIVGFACGFPGNYFSFYRQVC